MSINTQAIVLKLILASQDSDTILDFDNAKPQYFSESYRKIRNYLAEFHAEYGKLPNLSEIRLKYNRSSTILSTIEALEKQEIPEEIELSVAVDALKNEFAQQLTLESIKKEILPSITIMDSDELVEKLAYLQTSIAEALDTSDKVVMGSQVTLFEEEEDAAQSIVPTGMSERWDVEYGGTRIEELVLIGGKRGSGKSVMSMNMARHQHDIGNVCPYFTIEMTGVETMQRFAASMANVSAMDLRNKCSSPTDVLKLARMKASMFIGGDRLLEEYLPDIDLETCKLSDFALFDREIMKLEEKPDGIIIIDDRDLSLSSIDAHLTALKAKYGDKLKMAVVDYVNQIIVGDKADMYDWKDQLVAAKGLKNLARKHGITIVSPYQIDDSGEARLSKAILDPADYAMVIHKYNSGAVLLEASKVRSVSDVTFIVSMDWHSLTLNNEDLDTKRGMSLVGTSMATTFNNQEEIEHAL